MNGDTVGKESICNQRKGKGIKETWVGDYYPLYKDWESTTPLPPGLPRLAFLGCRRRRHHRLRGEGMREWRVR